MDSDLTDWARLSVSRAMRTAGLEWTSWFGPARCGRWFERPPEG